jgi:ectoine hydroxylase-related dioxygenase (phytanoyl-CoA dioxygenase family)
MDLTLSPQQKQQFSTDGFVLLEKILEQQTVLNLRDSFSRIFSGNFETGTLPDEVNWQEGKSDPELTRQICNSWKADRMIAASLFREDLGAAVADLMGWSGTRVMIDNAIWKPVGAKSLGFHQDDAYLSWFDPGQLCTVWMALDDVQPQNGAMELVRGSHRWGLSDPEGEFHAPEDYQKPMRAMASQQGAEPEIIPVAVPCGGGSIHHGKTWHGSGANTGSSPRRSLVLHAMPAEVRFRRENFHAGIGPIYSRYAKFGSDELDESYFPIIWRQDGYRTPGLIGYVNSSPIV